jgi:NAD(P)-dependent dehydrogenase (short-subunit alcohol dehydrogenase family)
LFGWFWGTRSWRAALAAGHQVVATARNPQALDKLVERYPGRLLTLPLDVGVIVDWDKAIAAATDRFDGIEVLVNNAGFGGVGSVEDIPVEIISRLLDTNFMGAARNGQQSVMALDIIALLDAFKIQKAVLTGFDWGARTADIMAAVWPERCRRSFPSAAIWSGSVKANQQPLPPQAELAWW